MRPVRITLLLCLAEVLGLSGLATFSALLPSFLDLWTLSHTRAGWLSAIYYGAYVVAVPILATLTDRRDARTILLFGLGLGAAAAVGFAELAAGFWSALGLRFLAGISLAGIYMPGLKLLSDHTEGPLQSRYVSFYTASFSIGTSLSYLLAGEIHVRFGWRWAFAVAGVLTLLGWVLVWLKAPAGKIAPAEQRQRVLTGLATVFRTRAAMAYILGYSAHMWELFSMRSWIVAFLAYSRSLQSPEVLAMSPTRVAAFINLIGVPASIGGNELCRRFGRVKTLLAIMGLSALVSVGVGFSASLPYGLVVVLTLVYGVVVLADSASLTAGAIANAPAEARGTTLAVHSTLGFGAAFLGPLATGLVLDLLQANASIAWAGAFICMGAGVALGPLVLIAFHRK